MQNGPCSVERKPILRSNSKILIKIAMSIGRQIEIVFVMLMLQQECSSVAQTTFNARHELCSVAVLHCLHASRTFPARFPFNDNPINVTIHFEFDESSSPFNRNPSPAFDRYLRNVERANALLHFECPQNKFSHNVNGNIQSAFRPDWQPLSTDY